MRPNWTRIVSTVFWVWMVYNLAVPDAPLNRTLRRASMDILNTLEPLMINIADTFDLIENYRVRRLFQTLRSTLYREAENMAVEVTEIAVNGRPALHHCPEGDYSKHLLPGIVYFHGGNWISGSAAEWLPLTKYLCNTTKAIIISIDYRLSPESLFPAAFEDCLKTTKTILEDAEQYGVDPYQIAIAGDEVGGNLALAVALNISKEEKDDKIRSEIQLVGMFYPTLQAFDFNLPSFNRYWYWKRPDTQDTLDVIAGIIYYLFGRTDHLLSTVMSRSSHVNLQLRESQFYKNIFDTELLPYSFRQYRTDIDPLFLTNDELEDEIKSLILDPRFSAMLSPVEDLSRLQYTYFIAAEVDPKRDDSFLAYARLLDISQTKTEHVYYQTEEQNFLMYAGENAAARSALDDFGRYFEGVLNDFKKPDAVEDISLSQVDVNS